MRAQTPTASAPVVTAAFLMNFVKFVEWPADALPPDAPMVMCIADPAVATALTGSLDNVPAGARPVSVLRVPAGAVPVECGVLYVADIDARRMTTLIAALRGRSVLAVSNATDFAKQGGTIQLFLEDGRMRLAINPQAAERARLRVSSRLLNLAVIVKE
jgi:hypothetical protein